MASPHIEVELKFSIEQIKELQKEADKLYKECRFINKLLMLSFILHTISFGLHLFGK